MRITRDVPKDGTKRVRKIFTILPMFFNHGSLNEPKRTLVWFDHYYLEEYYQYGGWNYGKRFLDDPTV